MSLVSEHVLQSTIRTVHDHPMTQGKIERRHRSMENVVKVENYYSPWELEGAIGRFISYCNERRYQESLGNIALDEYRRACEETASRMAS